MALGTVLCVLCFFFFNDTATTEIYTLSLHDALPIYSTDFQWPWLSTGYSRHLISAIDRKSTRLNSSHANISYAVFCLKKKHKLAHQKSRRNQMPEHTHDVRTTQRI